MPFKHPKLTADSAPFDADNPEWTDEMFAKAKPAHEVLPPEVLAAFPNTRRPGRPKSDNPKVAVTLRLDASVLERFKASGPGWQTRMNDALAKALEAGRG